jgi:hypothetical protein
VCNDWKHKGFHTGRGVIRASEKAEKISSYRIQSNDEARSEWLVVSAFSILLCSCSRVPLVALCMMIALCMDIVAVGQMVPLT